MTKMEALQHLQTMGITDGDAGYVVANKLAERAKFAKKGEVKVAATGVKAKAKPTKAVTPEQLVEAAKA
jgi:uncharacterized protein YoaH (UPF0181 family)